MQALSGHRTGQGAQEGKVLWVSGEGRPLNLVKEAEVAGTGWENGRKEGAMQEKRLEICGRIPAE